MVISPDFLDVRFTEITLLHILILLGLPYIVFYFLERFTKFDKFQEKWELALFLFVSGGFITLLSLYFQNRLEWNFWVFYFWLTFILVIALWIWALLSRTTEQKDKWFLIKLKNGKRFKAVISSSNPYFITIKGNSSNKIIEVDKNNKEIELDWKTIQFNTSEIFGIYSL
ncbi:MAG: hypothetical protein AABX23_04820 [Nanoarchaeota archaeon]